MHHLLAQQGENYLGLKLSGIITENDITEFVNLVKQKTEKNGQKRLLNIYVELFDDLHPEVKSFSVLRDEALSVLNSISKIALVGGKKYSNYITGIRGYLGDLQVRIFDKTEQFTAMEWITTGKNPSQEEVFKNSPLID